MVHVLLEAHDQRIVSGFVKAHLMEPFDMVQFVRIDLFRTSYQLCKRFFLLFIQTVIDGYEGVPVLLQLLADRFDS